MKTWFGLFVLLCVLAVLQRFRPRPYVETRA